MKAGVATDRMAFLALIALVLAGLLFLLLTTGIGNYALDDAYIVDHAVAGILSDHESRFVNSTPWQGVTSPAYVAAVALLSSILSIDIAHWAVSALSVVFLVCGGYALCRRNSLSVGMATGVALASLMAGMTIYQLANGLETGMAMAALTWTLVAFDHERPPTWGYILLGSLPFIRPEFAALALICIIFVAMKQRSGWISGSLVSVATFLTAGFLLLMAAGTLTPNTLSAKTYFFAEGCLPMASKAATVSSALWTFSSGLGLFAAGFFFVVTSRLRVIVVCFLIVFLAAYFSRFPGALFHNNFRYLYMLIPFSVLGWASVLGHGSRRVCSLAMIVGAIAGFLVFLSTGAAIYFYRDEVQAFSRGSAEMAKWVEENVPSDAVVLVHDAGRISLGGDQPLVDLVGLKSDYSADVHRRMTYVECRRVPSAVSDIARHARASYMIVTADWDNIFGLADSLRLTGWTVERADVERGNSLYRAYKISDSAKGQKD